MIDERKRKNDEEELDGKRKKSFFYLIFLFWRWHSDVTRGRNAGEAVSTARVMG